MKTYKVSSKIKNLLLNIIDFFWFLIFFIPNFFHRKDLNSKWINNILITRLDNIWDMVLTTSFIKNIRYNFPNSKITILCRPCQKHIIKNFDYIDEIITYDAFWFWWKDTIKDLYFIIKNNFRKFDLSFELHWEILSNVVTYFLGKYRIGFDIRWWWFLLHKAITYDWNSWKNIVEHQNQQILEIWWSIKYNDLELYLDASIKTIDMNNDKKNVIIHTWVSEKNREYKLKNWLSVIQELEPYYEVIIVDTDEMKLDFFKKSHKTYKTYKPQSIDEFIYLVHKSDLLIWLESLSSHISAALWKPTISLYSSTTPKNLFYPYWQNVHVLRSNKEYKNMIDINTQSWMDEISPKTVINKAKQLLG